MSILRFVRPRLAEVVLLLLVFSSSTVFAQATGVPDPAATPSLGQVFMRMLPLFAIVMLIFYFMVQLPQEKERRKQIAFLESLKKGSEVITSSGIIGRVAAVEKDHILLEIAPNVRVKVEPVHVTRGVEKSAPEAKTAGLQKGTA